MSRADRLDLAFPRSLKYYDKLGCALLLKGFKHYFLGNTNARIAKQWKKDFFADPSKFLEVEGRAGCDLHAA